MWSGIGAFGRFAFTCTALTALACGKTSRNDPVLAEAGGPGSAGQASAGRDGTSRAGASSLGGAGGGAGGGIPNAGSGGVSAAATEAWHWTACGSIEPFKPGPVQVAFAPAGDDLVVGYDDGSILLYTDSTRAPKRVLRDGGTQLDSFALSIDGEYLAASGSDFLEVTRLADGLRLPEIDLQRCPTERLRFSAEGDRLLAWGWESRELCIWSVADGALLHRLSGPFFSAALAGNGLLVSEVPLIVKAITLPDLVTVTVDIEALPGARGEEIFVVSPRADTFVSIPNNNFALFPSGLWSSEGRLLAQVNGFGLAYSPDGALVVLGDQLLDSRTGDSLSTVSRESLGPIDSDGSRVASVTTVEGTTVITIRELATGDALRVDAALSSSEPLQGLAISPDGSQLAVGKDIAVLWSIAPDFADSQQRDIGPVHHLQDVEFSPASELLVSGNGPRMYSAEATRLVEEVSLAERVYQGCERRTLRASPANRWLALVQQNGAVSVRDRALNGSTVATIETSQCNTRAAFSSDERYLATTEAALYRTSDWSRVWSKPRIDFPGLSALGAPEEDLYQDVAFLSGDTQLLVSHCEGKPGPDTCRYTLRSVADGALIRELPQLGAHRASVSPESHWVAAGNVLLHLPTDTVRTLDPAPSLSVFTPEGDLIGAGDDGTLTRYCRAR
ncbi:MAG TPA: WD40 repeat domain-containing protein [Polyangiaceae bacterium]|nr:WD40 repeat domain-containing protein [Polyangiaceae bacterium]